MLKARPTKAKVDPPKTKLHKHKYGSAIAEELIAGVQSLIDDMKSGKGITVREVSINMAVPEFSPDDIRAVRESLGLSQTLFAEFLGASASAIRAWERGAKIPTPMARRFLDSIRADPEYWLAKVRATMTTKLKLMAARPARQHAD